MQRASALKCYVFVGPTISEEEARSHLEAVYLPPVSQGDIISLLRYKPQVIGIIDGYFELVPSVWHKEILLAMSEGVHVVGGASMGALRAAELHSFGMVGIGEIFRWYRYGVIEADDEVAVRHTAAQHGYKAIGEALVSMRKTLYLAHTSAIISRPTLERLIELAKEIHYTRRSYATLFEQGSQAGIPVGELEPLRMYVERHHVDQKKVDALEVLRYIAELDPLLTPFAPTYALHRTTKLARLMDKDFCLGIVDGARLTAEMLINHVRLASNDFRGLRARALATKNRLQAAKQHGVAVTSQAYQQGAQQFRAALGLTSDEQLDRWLQRQHLAPEEFEGFLTEWVLVGKPLDAWPAPQQPSSLCNNQDLIRQLRLEGSYEAMVRGAVAKANVPLEVVPEATLYRYYMEHKGLKTTAEREAHITDLGFSSKEMFLLELTRQYLQSESPVER